MNENIGEDITIELLADTVHLSKSYFMRSFVILEFTTNSPFIIGRTHETALRSFSDAPSISGLNTIVS